MRGGDDLPPTLYESAYYAEWMRVGSSRECSTLDAWIAFSKRSPAALAEALCDIHWRRMIRAQSDAAKPAGGGGGGRRRCCDDVLLAHVVAVVERLAPARFSDYSDWVGVGGKLLQIDAGLLGAWIAFSKRSVGFVEGVCEAHWGARRLPAEVPRPPPPPPTQTDVPKAAKAAIRSLVRACAPDPKAVAAVVHRMFEHRFACSNVKLRKWWEFSDHRWRPSESGYGLRRLLSTAASAEFFDAAAEASRRSSRDEEALAKRLLGISKRLKNHAFKEGVVKVLAEAYFRDERFEQLLDSKEHLIGFENGVYDLDAAEFRDGRPDDYLTFSTGGDFVEHDEGSPEAQKLRKSLAGLVEDACVRERLLDLLGSFLHGGRRPAREPLLVWTGADSAGALVDLFRGALGDDYCRRLPAVASELAREWPTLRGKRFVSLQDDGDGLRSLNGLCRLNVEGPEGCSTKKKKKKASAERFDRQFAAVVSCDRLPDPLDDRCADRIQVVRACGRPGRSIASAQGFSAGECQAFLSFLLGRRRVGYNESVHAGPIRRSDVLF